MAMIYDHRGNEKEYIENTMKSFINSYNEGIETDVRLTLDNEIILHHDNCLTRIYKYPYFINKLYYDSIKENCKSIVVLYDFLTFCFKNNKKIILDVKEKTYVNICYIIDYCISFCKINNYHIKNIIFLVWVKILKPRKNINLFFAFNTNYIPNKKIVEYKKNYLIDGICLEYIGGIKNRESLKNIKKNGLLTNVYSNINNLNLNSINYVDIFTL